MSESRNRYEFAPEGGLRRIETGDYPPGTVAKVTAKLHEDVLVFRQEQHWAGAWRIGGYVNYDDTEVSDIRPLVVLDLSEYHVPALLAQLRRPGLMHDNLVQHVADQIEAQTTKPRPPEPTGRYAVVEDRDGREYVKIDPITNGETFVWQVLGQPTNEAMYHRYSELDIVKIHHEGVTK